MQLNRFRSPAGLLLALWGLCVLAALLAAEPALAKSSLGIGTAEVTMQPSGPLAGLFIEINRIQRGFFTMLRTALVAMKHGQGGAAFLVGLSFVYGIFHAAGPGHGKAVISSYMLASQVQLKRGIALSFVSALLQAGTAILAVGAGWFLLRGTAYSMTDATDALEIASYALIAAFGAFLTLRKLTRLARRAGRRRLPFGASPIAFSGGALSGGLAFAPAASPALASSMAFAPRSSSAGLKQRAGPAEGGAALLPATAAGGAIMGPASPGLSPDVCRAAEEDCGCGQPHMADPAALGAKRLSFGSAVSAVLAVGLRPCSGAVVVLSFALLNGLYVGGLLSVLAMALGTAVTVSVIAALAVFAKGAALRFGKAGGIRQGVLDATELAGAVLVLALGLLLLGSALA